MRANGSGDGWCEDWKVLFGAIGFARWSALFSDGGALTLVGCDWWVGRDRDRGGSSTAVKVFKILIDAIRGFANETVDVHCWIDTFSDRS